MPLEIWQIQQQQQQQQQLLLQRLPPLQMLQLEDFLMPLVTKTLCANVTFLKQRKRGKAKVQELPAPFPGLSTAALGCRRDGGSPALVGCLDITSAILYILRVLSLHSKGAI